jgi:pyruvate/2-oxoglutarate dehydrogenase complex dihydrolipoamide acyltransferase (E2) component
MQVGQPVAVVEQGAEAAPAAEKPADDQPAEEKPKAEAKNVPAVEQRGYKPDAPPPPPPPKKPEAAQAPAPKAEPAKAPTPKARLLTRVRHQVSGVMVPVLVWLTNEWHAGRRAARSVRVWPEAARRG